MLNPCSLGSLETLATSCRQRRCWVLWLCTEPFRTAPWEQLLLGKFSIHVNTLTFTHSPGDPRSFSVLLPLKFHQLRDQKQCFVTGAEMLHGTAWQREVMSSQPLCILMSCCLVFCRGDMEEIPLPAHLLLCCYFQHNRCCIMWNSLNKSNIQVC